MTAEAPTGELVIVTGMSGAGRSTAAKELEDLGHFVIDNLLPGFVPQVLDELNQALGLERPVAIVVDVRLREFLNVLLGLLPGPISSRRVTVLFLDAVDEVLVRRQEAVRRPHPLQGDGRLLDGINREREALVDLRGAADYVIDTTALNVHQLTARVDSAFATPLANAVRIQVTSFGFKYGIPIDADYVADVRFLPNPFWVPELQESTGLDAPVASYVYAAEGAVQFLDSYVATLAVVVPGYLREGKRHMRVAVGCTGGKHRSVAMVEEITRRLTLLGHDVTASHRDLGRE